MIFKKKGLLFSPNKKYEWSQTHAQVPTCIKINDSILRIFYSTRNNLNQSCISFIDVDPNNIDKILYEHNIPVLEKGAIGSFDDAGVMPSSIVQKNGKLYLYYTGWMVRSSVPYHNSIGLAVSIDNGLSFTRLFNGPIFGSINTEPFFVGTACVIFDGEIWKAWYSVCTKWEKINGIMEPYYHIKYAESNDGIIWNRNGNVAIDYKNQSEGGIVRASILRVNNEYNMWYSYRNVNEYRTNINNSYRIGFASSMNGVDWLRKDNDSGISVSENGWDSQMIAYADMFFIGNKLIMFYNGNDFGKNGFGYAVTEL